MIAREMADLYGMQAYLTPLAGHSPAGAGRRR
jgi:hypothetical protein